MDAKKIIELRKQAEKAVADMQDGEFKLKAFEVILNHFLSPVKPESTTDSSAALKEGAKRQRSVDKETESTVGRILVLKDEGFMSAPKSISQIRAELQAHGWHYPVTTLSGMLIKLVQKRELRRQKGKLGKRNIWLYTNS